MTREFEVVVWGATGFTGRLVAEYLCAAYGINKTLKWAIAGRNPKKLEEIKGWLTKHGQNVEGLVTIIADSFDEASLRAMASRADVICTTVGPYSRYGSKLVEACLDEGTDYCDLTGEVHWVREMIDTHHERAVSEKRRIVNFCGMDSIPSDLGVFALQGEARTRFGKPLEKVTYYMGKNRSALSGGTIASMLAAVEQVRANPKLRRVLGDPYGLNPRDAPRGPDGSDPMKARWDDEMKGLVTLFIMGSVNTRVVRRTNAICGFPYGEQFSYQEWMTTPPGTRGKLMAHGVPLGMGLFFFLSAFSPTRELMKGLLLPKPGEGPTRKQREEGYYNIHILGEGKDDTGRAVKLRCDLYGDKDPGYGSTAQILAEAAICLVKDRDALPDQYGFVTPAAAMGEHMLTRLKDAGLSHTFSGDEATTRPAASAPETEASAPETEASAPETEASASETEASAPETETSSAAGVDGE